MKAILLVTTGGAIGSVLRYLVALWMRSIYTGIFPWHTFAVNVIGCLLAGLMLAWSLQHLSFENIRLFLMIGILGGFTTFSGFGLEVFAMLKERQILLAVSYIIGSNMLGVIAVYSGYQLFKFI